MTLIAVQSFNGLKPITAPRLLGNNETQIANNAVLISGQAVPLNASTVLKATTSGQPKTIFRYGNSTDETQYWLEFANDTDVMRSPIANDQWQRLYWTNGDGIPRYAPNDLILSGSSYPGASYQLGIPKPSVKIAITGHTDVVNYTTVTREYAITLYNPTTNKESAPSQVISTQAVDGKTVSFSNLTTDNQGDAGVTKKRLYRKVSGTYRLVVELDLSTTTYDDTATDASLASAATITSTSASIPSPTNAPTLSAASASVSSATSRKYVYTIKNVQVVGNSYDSTFVTNYSESAPSAPVTISADATQTVTLTGFSNNLSGSAYRIYRQDTSSGQYLFVGEIPLSTTSFADNIAVTKPGSPLQYDAPSTAVATGTLGAVASSSSAGSVVSRVYMVTFLDSSGNESARGPASAAVSVVDGSTTVYIVHSESFPAGVTKKRIYRQTVASGASINEANWKRVSEVTASTVSGTDSAPDSSLTQTYSSSLQGLPPTPTTTTATTNPTIPPKKVPEYRTYVCTYVSAYGEEGPPNDAADVVQLDPDQPVTISLPNAPTGNFNIISKRIYRSSTNSNSTAKFQFVDEVDVALSSYTDSKLQADLGEVLPSETWLPPPAGLKGLRMMANGVAVGFVGRTVYFSEPNLPHAWPNQYSVDDDIIAIGTFGQAVAVITKSYPHVFSGIDPAAMSDTKLKMPLAGASKRSLVETADGVVYCAPEGLATIGQGGVSLLTTNIFSREQWQSYKPSSMECYQTNGRTMIFYDNGTTKGVLVFDLSGQGALLTTTDINAATAVTAGYLDPTTDILYLAQGGSIVRFNSGSALTMTIRSKLYRMPYQQNLTYAQVRASAYPVTFNVYVGSTLKFTKTVTSGDAFRLPSGFRGLNWEFEVIGQSTLQEVFLATSGAELRSA